jgi:hypothetical protein
VLDENGRIREGDLIMVLNQAHCLANEFPDNDYCVINMDNCTIYPVTRCIETIIKVEGLE